MEERKFVCKYCSKRFPCGKSLGGHIRIHMMNEHSLSTATMPYSNTNEFEYPNRKRKRDFMATTNNDSDFCYGYGYGGGVKENPKKTKSSKFCKECGKGFPSLKALCGHMACHSEKERGTNNRFQLESNSGISEKQKLVLDSNSDTETSVPVRRSKRMRYKNFSSNNSNPFYCSSSSSVSEIEQEQQEVARCLMMLSKDTSYKGQFMLFANNNSAVLEAKLPFVDEKKKIGYDSDNSDSGYFRYGPKKKVDSDYYDDDDEVNDNGDSRRNKNWKLESLTSEDCSALESHEFNNNITDTDSKSHSNKKINVNNKGKSKSKKKKKKKVLKSKKNKEHECPICNRVFRSGQALGGHKRSHFIGGSEENTLFIRPDATTTVVPCLIDLNLPAPVEDAPF
ncbi:hypothetical protein PIB30_105150 [Stylosanthes scabra]|uniref:C2H2-type domain-containing protein n=1 Tax=Stylosanthes scabra TaxID=79078 RepID=A0ABU6SYS0_9FABA|nr:hypothetical protein [Stylosanthes scabra]